MRNSAFDPAVRMALAAGGALGKRSWQRSCSLERLRLCCFPMKLCVYC